MQLSLRRIHSGNDSTIGELCIDGEFFCFTCEDEYRTEKVAGKTRIPAGTYPIVLRAAGGMHQRYSKKFPGLHRGMLHLQNVDGFKWVYIHIGNNHENTLGCLLVGFGADTDPGGGTVRRSTEAYHGLYEMLIDALDRGEELTINITDEPSAAMGTTGGNR